MPLFYIELDGAPKDSRGDEFPSIEAARNAAIVRLGAYLQTHPEFAFAQHWRVDVLDSERRLILHVIVGTVIAAPKINWASFER